jgi:hypothetical protein
VIDSVRKATGRTVRVQFPIGARDFSSLHSVDTGLGYRPASYTICTGGTFPVVKRPERGNDRSPSSGVEIKNGRAKCPLSKRLVVGCPPRRPGFEPGSGQMGVVVDKVVLGQVFSEYFGFPCQS